MFHQLLAHGGLIHLVEFVGYPGLFAAVFLESGVFFGFFLPGSSMLFTAGLLATQGLFNIWILIPFLTVAAVGGDSAGYWFGNTVGVSLFFKKDSRFFKHAYLEQAREFYEKHGVQAVILARFIPIVRTFAPIIAGIANMRYRIFLAYNIVGGLLWAAGLTFTGFYLGRRFIFLNHYITPIALVIIVVSLIPIFWEIRKPRE
ncbi:MAG TPA: VTT domain-containing protein [Candidatus Paceibacterota bacterium]|nr:VTT domain-containing protein [Candidatus Paceibacterota bacterium]